MPQQILIYMYLTCLFDHDGILPKKSRAENFRMVDIRINA